MGSSSTIFRFVGRRLSVSARIASYSEVRRSRPVDMAVSLSLSSEMEPSSGPWVEELVGSIAVGSRTCTSRLQLGLQRMSRSPEDEVDLFQRCNEATGLQR